MKSLWPISLHSALRLHLFHRGQHLQDATTCNINTGVGEPRGSFWRETLLHGGCGCCPLLWPFCPSATRSPKGNARSHLCRSYKRSLGGKSCCCCCLNLKLFREGRSSYTNQEVQGRGGGTCSSIQYKHKELCSAKQKFFCLLCKAHRGVPHGGTEQQGCLAPRAKSKCLLTERKYSCSDMAWHAQLWWKFSPVIYINQTELFLKTKRSICSIFSSHLLLSLFLFNNI